MMRTINRMLSLILAVALIGGGLLAAYEAVLALTHRPPWLLPIDRWYDTVSRTEIGDNVALLVAGIVGAVGLVLLIAEVRPWPPYRLRVQPDDGAGEWWLLRRPAERRLAAVLTAPARVKLRGRGDRWRVKVRATAIPADRARVEQELKAELTRLAAPADSRLKLRLRKPKDAPAPESPPPPDARTTAYERGAHDARTGADARASQDARPVIDKEA